MTAFALLALLHISQTADRPYDGALAVEGMWEQGDMRGQADTSEAIYEGRPKQTPPGKGVANLPVNVAVGLAPELLGTREETALVDRLVGGVSASVQPRAQVRRLRPGVGDGASVCRERRDDFVVQLGTLVDREGLVVLPYDCRLGRQLPVRGLAAVDAPELVAALWNDHRMLVQQGARERKTWGKLGPKARTAIIASVVVAGVAVAVGILLGTTLRKQEIVITVKP